MNRNAWKHTARLAEVVEWAGTSAQVRIGGRDVVLSHFPYTRDREATRYPQWRLPNVGTWLLHGHTHGEERVTRRFRSEVVGVVPETYGFRHRYTLESEVHVGWDAWKRPVADYEVAELIRTAEEAERV
jgi:calcineurin-like phosphoesterase family protein